MGKLQLMVTPPNYYSTYLHKMEEYLNKFHKVEFYGLVFQLTYTLISNDFNDLTKNYRLIVFFLKEYRLAFFKPCEPVLNTENIIRFVYKQYDNIYKLRFLKVIKNQYDNVYLLKKKNEYLTWLIYMGNELPFLCKFDSYSKHDTDNKLLYEYISIADKYSMILGIIDIIDNNKTKCTYYFPQNTDNIYKLIFVAKYINEFNINFYSVLN